MTHPTDDPLRAAAQAVLDRWDSLDWKAAPTADYMNRLRAALAAAPQPSPAPADERAAMIEVIFEALCETDARWDMGDPAEFIADALLAAGWTRGGDAAGLREAVEAALCKEITGEWFTVEANERPLVNKGETEFVRRKEVNRILDVLKANVRAALARPSAPETPDGG